ncbi:MAG: hypothetical protein KIT48_09840 [Pseudolabrys sp.]|nr:hypothetical protein [Pseudolabrys sp.]
MLSIRSAQRNAVTAASTGCPTGSLDAAIDRTLVIARNNAVLNTAAGANSDSATGRIAFCS